MESTVCAYDKHSYMLYMSVTYLIKKNKKDKFQGCAQG